jgi:hypothetical protein
MKPNEKNKIYCPAYKGQKLQFDSFSAALKFIEKNSEEIKNENGYAPIRAYYCPSCGCFHITSKEIRERPEGRPPRVGYSIDPWLTETYEQLQEAIKLVEIGETRLALHQVQNTVPLIFWELRMTAYKAEQKQLQKKFKEFIRKFGRELKHLKDKEMKENRILLYKEGLKEIEKKGGQLLHSEDRRDTSHLAIILGRKEELGEEQWHLAIEIIFKFRKLISMFIIGANILNIDKTWNEIDAMVEKIKDPELLEKLEYMKNLIDQH